VQTPNISYSVTEADVLSHAPIVFKSVKRFYKKIAKVSDYIQDVKLAKNVISGTQDEFGVASHLKEYSPNLLNNEEFRMAVIYHYSISKALGSTLPWGEYLLIKDCIEEEMKTSRYQALSLDSHLLRVFKVDPATVLPKTLARIMRFDEFNQATDIIIKEINKLKHPGDGFEDYERYYQYVRFESVKIEKKCHDSEFYGTHDIDRFACICIAYRMKLPTFDHLYKISDMPPSAQVTTENVKNMQDQIITQILGQ